MKHSRSRTPSFDLLSGFDWFIPGWIDFMWIGIMLGVGVVISSIAAISLSKAGFAPIYVQTISYPLLFIPAMLLASSQSRRNVFRIEPRPLDRPENWKGVSALVAVSGMLALAFLLDPLNLVLPEPDERIKAAMKMLADGPIVISLLCTAVFAPFFEEWLFRGIVLRGLLGKIKPFWAILISSLVFGLFHLNLWQAIPATLMGLLLGYVYWKSGSLKLTMLMHCANNTLSVILMNIHGVDASDTIYDLIPNKLVYGGIAAVALAALVASIIYFSRKTPAQAKEE
ncbi:MAG: CPBP family intramembrane metalloprotease [Bacteroidales bacterium]|nr:CPBP family intramembrane metalloprotease [Bacteroidales bacterium]